MQPEMLEEKFSDLYDNSRDNIDQSESKLKSRFHKSKILEDLGYEESDIKVEKSDKRGKRTDIHCTDEYGNVNFVIEFKKPNVDVSSSKHKKQLVERYMKPLKADFGILYNGLKVVAYTREGLNSKHLFTKRADNLGEESKQIIKLGQKPDYSLTKISNVRDYFEKFDKHEEKLELVEESAREHFFENFKLEKNSSFENLLLSTIDLFQAMKGENQFLDSAFRFWKESYAKKPEEVPSSWENIMDRSGLSGKSELYEFMFCLETSYAVFARLIMAKSGEDYEFSDANFSRFIETEVDRASRRGDIAGASWAKVTQELIGDMRDNLVDSVFEEDIFYWWTEPYEDRSYNDLFHVKQIPNETIKFGTSIGKIILMIYKFNFSKIDGDPLGVLYQQYFDKETRKALGEFYTPQEVVDYILDSVDYNGRQILDKRLLDPACGSGTFPVSALQRYLNTAEKSGKAEKEGWDQVLDELCNQYRIVGFDIHPFATIMAQIQFMLILMPYYKKAIEDAQERNEHFKIQRIPIFRTDSLKDESKGENPTLNQFEGGEKFKMDVKLPVNKEEGGDFFDEEFAMPTPQAARKVGLHNNQQYFGALQAFFDVIKDQASEMEDTEEIADFDRERFEDHLGKYSLTDKDWNQISTLFQSFADNLLTQIKRLQTEFDDGRLIKSIEDIYLAALIKNEQKYDYVVGNPPYVRIQHLSDEQKQYYNSNYDSSTGNYDLYCPFIERGLDWLSKGDKLGYITPNQFQKNTYGEGVKKVMLSESQIEHIFDFQDSQVFPEATNYPQITVWKKKEPNEDHEIDVVRASRLVHDQDIDGTEFMEKVAEYRNQDRFSNDLIDIFQYPQEELDEDIWSVMPSEERQVFDKIKSNGENNLDEVTEAVFQGIRTSKNYFYIVETTSGEYIEPGKEDGDTEITPTGYSGKYTVEKDLLRPFVRGREIRRWTADWSGRHVVHPYYAGDNPKLVTKEEFEDKYPKTWAYFKEYEDQLRGRESGRMEDRDEDWYAYIYPKNLNKFEEPKIIGANIVSESRFVYDPGELYFTAGYGVKLKSQFEDYTAAITAILNSDVGNFVLKHIADIKMGGYYAYETQYLNRLPVRLDDEKCEEIETKVEKIQEVFTQKKLVDNFSRYVSENFNGEQSLKVLKCNSGHPDMEPSIQTTQDGMFDVEVGRRKTDSILLDTKEKARFVKKALVGDSASKGEEIEILVPRSNSDVKEILQEYEDDKEKLEEMPSVEELQEEINELVYDLYELNDEEIDVIEDFLGKF